ncbi:MAG: hypothetical protein M3O70_21565 [Actinomycetota bacterium]|nr:hypothetical protein [Actinomycetota bacterium]
MTALDELRRRTVVEVWPTGGQAMGYQSKSAAYRAATRGDLPTIRLGKRKLVCPTWQLLALLGAEEPSNGDGPAPSTPSRPHQTTTDPRPSPNPKEQGRGQS